MPSRKCRLDPLRLINGDKIGHERQQGEVQQENCAAIVTSAVPEIQHSQELDDTVDRKHPFYEWPCQNADHPE